MIHPITGKPYGPKDADLPGAVGEVVQAMSDADGKIVLLYADGNVFGAAYDKRSDNIVCVTMTPPPAETVQ